ncbi:carboxylesterase/lipase family protein [Gimibacter soli]|uniref:Carboxylic ester hydrolase n=1 Tax=Gimibacter soli TaxID=3024400 RepID=A0AAF0BIC6_9PROT|nr:carboxylesterase family protein [Gimibacter soli]WCL55228.1 carboxylesterase family protein [Gimibacter soli]
MKLKPLLIMMTAFCGWTAASASAARPEVTVAEGRLAGVTEAALHIFKGIPYALPPVGERRWKIPEPPASWQGVRDAGAFGPACVQPPMPQASVYFDPPAAMDEDCLTLNVWAPEKAEKAPVIVWIHGGALQRGHTSSPLYDGANLARKGVVFVSLNYRLGVLGWMAHPDLSAESQDGISGNYGLTDQIRALEWVRDNIVAFGGDPANVTVMGESAGALSVTYLLSSPKARGLFHKAIVESANIRAVPNLKEAAHGMPSGEAIGVAVMKGVGAESLSALRELDATAITLASMKARFVPQGTAGGHGLPAQVVDIFDEGAQARVPLLIGFNSGEIRSQRIFVPKAPETAADYEAEIRARYGDLADAFLKGYPADDIANSMLATVRDAVYGWASEHLAHKQSAAGQPAYLYLFDHCDAVAAARDLCAFHASELPFVFGQAGAGGTVPPNWPRPEGSEDEALSAAMMEYWVTFAKTGVPSSPGHDAWRPYGDDEAFMRFDGVPVAGRNPVPGMFEMQEELVSRRRAAGQQWFINVGVIAEKVPEKHP